MTSCHKIKLEFNPLYLKHIIFEIGTSISTLEKFRKQTAVYCSHLFLRNQIKSQTNYSGISTARKVKAVNGVLFYEQNAHLG